VNVSKRRRRGVVATVVFAAMVCGTDFALAGEDVPAAAAAEADKVWTSRCTHCHGPSGAGDGPVSAKLDPHPRALNDPEWQRGVNDAHIETVIVKGGSAVRLSPFMPGNPDLASKGDVVRALRMKVRSLAAH